jgi:hypothetical protein
MKVSLRTRDWRTYLGPLQDGPWQKCALEYVTGRVLRMGCLRSFRHRTSPHTTQAGRSYLSAHLSRRNTSSVLQSLSGSLVSIRARGRPQLWCLLLQVKGGAVSLYPEIAAVCNLSGSRHFLSFWLFGVPCGTFVMQSVTKSVRTAWFQPFIKSACMDL